MKNLENLKFEESVKINGGCFSFDLGFAIGGFLNHIGGPYYVSGEEAANYASHYANETECS